MIAEMLEAVSEITIVLAPERELFPALLCEKCDRVLVEPMIEEGRDELIEALTGETIMYTTHQRVCFDCYINDDTENPYIRADYYR